ISLGDCRPARAAVAVSCWQMSEQSERAAYIAGLETFRAELETCRAECMASMARLEAELEAKFIRKLETLQDELCAAREEIARLRGYAATREAAMAAFAKSWRRE